jgi:hypothetical protein
MTPALLIPPSYRQTTSNSAQGSQKLPLTLIQLGQEDRPLPTHYCQITVKELQGSTKVSLESYDLPANLQTIEVARPGFEPGTP